MKRSVFMKVGGVALALSVSLASCASMEWVGTKMDPALKGMESGASIGVVPFAVEYKSSEGVVKMGKELASQDRTPAWLPYNVKTVVASPDAIRDYAVTQSDLSLLTRDIFVDFIQSKEPFDITVSKDFQVKRYASADQESNRTVSYTGTVRALQGIGAFDPLTVVNVARENGVKYILGGTIQIQGETAYITPRQTKGSNASTTGSPSQWKPGDAFAEFYITYKIELYSGETGLKVDSSDNYKLEFHSTTNTPYVRIPGVTISEFLGIPDVSVLSNYMNSSLFKFIVQDGLTAALADYTPLLKSYFELVYQEQKKK